MSEQVRAWARDPDQDPEKVKAFWETTEHLRQGTWGAVGLVPSLVFPGFFHASTPTGEWILVRFGVLPPVAAVFLVYVGSGDEEELL